MKSKILGLLTVVLLAGPMTANAVLIDNGSYTTDTANGLEWLDLSLTRGMSVTDALAAYSGAGYYYADDALVSGLLASFGITYNFSVGTLVALTPTLEASTSFLALLGLTINDGGGATLGSFALAGLGRSGYLCISNGRCGPASFVNDFDLSSRSGDFRVGIFLVRAASSVPEPGTLALLGLGLAGLGFARRRKLN